MSQSDISSFNFMVKFNDTNSVINIPHQSNSLMMSHGNFTPDFLHRAKMVYESLQLFQINIFGITALCERHLEQNRRLVSYSESTDPGSLPQILETGRCVGSSPQSLISSLKQHVTAGGCKSLDVSARRRKFIFVDKLSVYF